MELAIDTSTRYASVALTQEGDPLAEFCWRSERNHTRELMPAIQRLLEGIGAEMRELDAIFVSRGPGGFSALRVGMSAAKGMAEALDIPLIGIGTLEIEAFPYATIGPPLCPLLEVGRGEVAWALFQERHGLWQQLIEEEIATPEEACLLLPEGAVVCGEAAWTLRDRLREILADRAILMAVPPPTRQAFTLARLGVQRLAHGEPNDRAALQPLYMRRPSVTMPRSTV